MHAGPGSTTHKQLLKLLTSDDVAMEENVLNGEISKHIGLLSAQDEASLY